MSKQMKKNEFVWITSFDAKLTFTVQSARQQLFLTKQCSTLFCKFCNVKCANYVYVIHSFEMIKISFRALSEEIQRTREMNVVKNIVDFGRLSFHSINPWRKSSPYLGHSCFRLSFCLNSLHFSGLCLSLETSSFKDLWQQSCLGWSFV